MSGSLRVRNDFPPCCVTAVRHFKVPTEKRGWAGGRGRAHLSGFEEATSFPSTFGVPCRRKRFMAVVVVAKLQAPPPPTHTTTSFWLFIWADLISSSQGILLVPISPDDEFSLIWNFSLLSLQFQVSLVADSHLVTIPSRMSGVSSFLLGLLAGAFPTLRRALRGPLGCCGAQRGGAVRGIRGPLGQQHGGEPTCAHAILQVLPHEPLDGRAQMLQLQHHVVIHPPPLAALHHWVGFQRRHFLLIRLRVPKGSRKALL